MSRPRRITIGADGLLYVPVYTGDSSPAIVRVDPDAFDPLDFFANQEIVASGGLLNRPWDVDFDENGFLLAVMGDTPPEVIRLDVNAYNPLDELANQELVASGGTLTEPRGIAIDENGLVILTDQGNQTAVRLDPDAFDPLDLGSNQTTLASGPPMVEPRGADVVGPSTTPTATPTATPPTATPPTATP